MSNKWQSNQRAGGAIAIALAMAVLISALASGCGDVGGGVTEQPSTLITPDEGGGHSFGQVQITFPPGSVDNAVTVTGKTVSLEEIPSHITLLTDVHQVSLSNPDQYNSRTATLRFTLEESAEDANIYHSTDGANWENLVGDTDGNTISGKVNRFSYFFAGTPGGTFDSTRYRVDFRNNSWNSGDVCIFQTPAETTTPVQYSTAWMTKFSHPTTNVVFLWTKNFSFCWGETGSLMPGVVFWCNQIIDADLASKNEITLAGTNNAGYAFTDQKVGPQPGLLYINQSEKIPYDRLSIGIAMSGSPVFVAQALPNMLTTFPTSSKYWIAFGPNYRQGEVLDIRLIYRKAQLSFPPGVFTLKVTLNQDFTWTIEPS
ncbi:MAG: hypothetical protein JRL30_21690 [Deltaproteobacteria bacterium]|nr:hypothetical protein [Deltaproteobacteria bacterium]